MRLLWLALADTDPPMNGQFVFTGGLLRAAARYCDSIHIVAFSLPWGAHLDGQKTGNIVWHLVEHSPRPAWTALFSSAPRDILRTKTAEFERRIEECLEAENWDSVIFDTHRLAWALDLVRAKRPQAATVYLSHNHEEAVARELLHHEQNPIRSAVHRIDLAKVCRWERRLARTVDMATANCPDYFEELSAARSSPDQMVEYVAPGYSGCHVSSRTISSAVPRRVVVVSSLDWLPKRQGFEEFFSIADAKFAEAGVELCVVGGATDDYLESLRRRAKATVFTGHVADVSAYLKEARIGLVIENVGGLKLKTLDYVFNRVPLFGRVGAVPGLPLVDRRSVMLFDDYEKLVDGILASIDDIMFLNTLHQEAYRSCADQFEWDQIGSRFISAVSQTLARKRAVDPSSSALQYRWSLPPGDGAAQTHHSTTEYH